MLLDKIRERNVPFIKALFELHQNGDIQPDSYVIDVDNFLANAKKMLDSANENNLKLYFMLKQVGRNPYLAKRLIELGYEGAVVVDYKEAKVMMDNNIPIGNVGHLVQVPNALLEQIILYKPEVITVYSLEKIKLINQICQKHNIKQAILIRVYDDQDMIYSGQTAGFHLKELENLLDEIKQLDAITIGGVTSFPTLLYDDCKKEIIKTANLETVLNANNLLKKHGILSSQINLPSATCCASIPLISSYGGTHGEPGHGLSGTTPLHANLNSVEIPCVAYVSEISHNFDGISYCYGGGHYRRSYVKNALIGKEYSNVKTGIVIPPTDESIDYHFGIKGIQNIGDTVIMAFRFQIFVTRSDVILVTGINKKEAKIIGRYNSLGGSL